MIASLRNSEDWRGRFIVLSKLSVPRLRSTIRVNIPLARFTTWHLGGPAEYLFEPADEEDRLRMCTFTHQEGFLLTVLGNGSNVLISDDGVRGMVVRLRQPIHSLLVG